MQEEIWKDIPGLEGKYQASNFGNIKRLTYVKNKKNPVNVPEYIVEQRLHKGYMYAIHGVRGVTPIVHRLVALAFIPNPENKKTVNHIDGNKLNNNLSNLEWSTHSEQMQHASQHSLLEVRGAPKFSKEFKKEVLDYYNNLDTKIPPKELGKLYGMSERTAWRIINEGVTPRPTTRILKTGEIIIEDIITKQQVREIKELRSQGMTYDAIGKIYNRSISQIFRIVKDQSRTTDIE